MTDLDGCGWTLMLIALFLLIILVGFFFHIGWDLLDYMMG